MVILTALVLDRSKSRESRMLVDRAVRMGPTADTMAEPKASPAQHHSTQVWFAQTIEHREGHRMGRPLYRLCS